MNATSAACWLLLAPALVAQDVSYTTFIRQHQQTTGMVWHMPVDLVGEALSPLVVEDGGSLFQLWAIRNQPITDYLLDQKIVGAYLPGASAWITSEDSHPGVARTRCDRPFQLQVDVSGLLSGPNVPDAATRVLLQRYAQNYPESQTLTLDQALANGPIESSYINENGIATFDIPLTALNGPDPTKLSGEEHFIVHALPDGEISQTQIAATMVQIWPVASGDISGVQSGETLGTKPPKLTVSLEGLYPSSSTWLQIYPGAPALGTVGTKLPGSILVLDQDKPEDRVLRVDKWASTLEQDGLHTIELLHQTPFGIDRLDHVTVQVNRVLQVRANLTNFDPPFSP